MEKVKGLRSPNWYLLSIHKDLKCSTGNIVSDIVTTVWCQVGTGNNGGSLCKVCDCLTAMLYT